jgi:diguanylate cyclase (GGDEF)-like protein
MAAMATIAHDFLQSANNHLLMLVAAGMCLFGTWIGMRHFARARATEGPTRYGWLFMAAVGTGGSLWASLLLTILALQPNLSAFDPMQVASALIILIAACLAGLTIASRKNLTLAPEIGGVVVGAGLLAALVVDLHAWHLAGQATWSRVGVGAVIVLALGLSALAINRANRPVTRWCRHGAAIVMTFMICMLHLTAVATVAIVPDPSIALSPEFVPAKMIGLGVVCAMALVMGLGFSSHVIDMRSRTEAADRIHQLSFNDTMTGLPNRIAFNERLAFDVADAHEKAHKLAAFSIDIDGFKDVNDVFGHAAGDLLLIEVAERMRRVLGEGEFLARQSGDEFLGLQMAAEQTQAAQAFAERLTAALARPFDVKGSQVHLTASIGYSVFPTDTRERDQLLSNAKLAMYRAKSTQRGLVRKYEPEMDDAERKRRALARDLTDASARNQLELYYQPQTSLQTARVTGAEALLRWRHPRHGMVSPAEFIPLAEETEAIIPIGEWALRTACRDAASGKVPGVVAVNLSPVQFSRDDLAETIQAILIETGLPPRRLEVEVTESTLMSDQTRGIHTLRKLKAMGIAVAMDDFGTGYSSLATLHAFPFDKIKLDRSFVQKVPNDRAAAAIVCTVLALGRSLSVPILAEGIETKEHWRFLSTEGCQQGQGYLMGKPVAVEQLADVLRKWDETRQSVVVQQDEAAQEFGGVLAVA